MRGLMTVEPDRLLTDMDRLDREHQLKALRDDEGCYIWEEAHLALFIMHEMEIGNTRWLQLLDRANKAYRRRDLDTFENILETMDDMLHPEKIKEDE